MKKILRITEHQHHKILKENDNEYIIENLKNFINSGTEENIELAYAQAPNFGFDVDAYVEQEYGLWFRYFGFGTIREEGKNTQQHLIVLCTGADKIREISLAHYKLTSVPKSILMFHNLVKLSLRDNLFTIIPNFIGDLKHLVNLNLSNCNLDYLPTFIKNLTELSLLNISNNNIIEIPQFVFELSLTSLIAQSNQITKLPSDLTNDSLRIINLTNNPIPTIEKERIKREFMNLNHLYI